MKKKPCPVCKNTLPTNNKRMLIPHERWDWPGYPDSTPRSSEMQEVRCEGSDKLSPMQ